MAVDTFDDWLACVMHGMKVQPAMPFPLHLTDARSRRHTLARPPRRIVSLVPSQTELLAHLGLDDEVVGLTRFCVHPEEWKSRKVIIGGTKQVDRERIARLEPDLILGNLEENTRAMVEALDPLAPVFVTDVRTVPEALAMIRTVGQLTQRDDAAQRLAGEIDARFTALPDFTPLRTIYLIWNDPIMTVGGDTFIHDVMARAGLVNVFGDRMRYPVVSADELAGARPNVLLLSSEPYPFAERHRAAFQDLLPEASVHRVDGEPFSWYGSRLLRSPAFLRDVRATLAGHQTPHRTGERSNE